MNVRILLEAGHEISAGQGLALSHNASIEKMPMVANRLYSMDGGHNKFLEGIMVWIDISAPRYWWQQFDTYRIGVSKQSSSTMHTLTRSPLTQEHFENPIPEEILSALENLRLQKNFADLKNLLPEGFLQTRIVVTNYMTLRRIIDQRMNHRLSEWHQFCHVILSTIEHKNLFRDLAERFNDLTDRRNFL